MNCCTVMVWHYVFASSQSDIVGGKKTITPVLNFADFYKHDNKKNARFGSRIHRKDE